jgi:hypothetical protein
MNRVQSQEEYPHPASSGVLKDFGILNVLKKRSLIIVDGL